MFSQPEVGFHFSPHYVGNPSKALHDTSGFSLVFHGSVRAPTDTFFSLFLVWLSQFLHDGFLGTAFDYGYQPVNPPRLYYARNGKLVTIVFTQAVTAADLPGRSAGPIEPDYESQIIASLSRPKATVEVWSDLDASLVGDKN
jgi:hypothetical protein